MRVIEAKNLSKQYVLGREAHNSLRDAVTGLFTRKPGGSRAMLMALDDVSFNVGESERLGIIGRNGAGKSTLLKILSQITKPTTGSAIISGRVGSLLEVGTGFHNELSGRENIFLNGAILGMKRTEIATKFDEIIAFSEIERFLDTPVKHYSSGMYMRLAFAIAAHLEPEILIVDEVLAVGDAAFQKKCLNKMREVGQIGRTVLFVSHDMSAITRLCDRVIWLKDGKLQLDGEAKYVVGEYLHDQSKTGAEKIWEAADKSPGNDITRLRRVRVCDENGRTAVSIDIRKGMAIEMTYDVTKPGHVLVPNIHFYNEQGVCIFISHDWNSGWRSRPRDVGTYKSKLQVPGNFLSEGPIFVTAVVTTYIPLNVHFSAPDVVTFNVIDSNEDGSARGDYAGVLPGIIRPVLDWQTIVE